MNESRSIEEIETISMDKSHVDTDLCSLDATKASHDIQGGFYVKVTLLQTGDTSAYCAHNVAICLVCHELAKFLADHQKLSLDQHIIYHRHSC